jgi:stearoyl-CoA desaturase (delta-9 desaturase)
VINGVGHWFGYRNSPTEDVSTNMAPWGILIGGEELHNNHHAFPTSAKFSSQWFEFDLGWVYLRIMSALGLAKIKHVAPVPQFVPAKAVADEQTLKAIVRHRYHVLASYEKALQSAAETRAVETMHAMRDELVSLWERSMATREQLVARLEDWCKRAEASGVRPLVEFSRRLRSYA